MLFECLVIDNGKKLKLKIEADNIESANFELLEKGYDVIVSIKKGESFFSFEDEGMTRKERSIFLNTLATLSVSMSIDRALNIMIKNYNGRIKSVCLKLNDYIKKGTSLEESIELIGGNNFPTIVSAMIKAGMQTGSLSTALRDTAEFENELYMTEKEAKKGLLLQILMFVFSMLLIFGCQYWFVPYVLEEYLFKLFKGVDISWIDRFANMVTSSMFFIVSIAGALIFVNSFVRGINAVLADKIIEKIPFYNKLILSKKRFVYIYQLSRMINRGIPLEVSLQHTISNMEKGKLKADFEKAIVKISQGGEWVEELTSFSEIDRAALSSATDKTKTAAILNELSLNNKINYKDQREFFSKLIYAISIIYTALATLILFFYTTMPMLDGINNL